MGRLDKPPFELVPLSLLPRQTWVGLPVCHPTSQLGLWPDAQLSWRDRGDRECYDLPAGWLVMDDAALDAAVGVVVAARMKAEARASERRAAAKEAEERAALARLRAKYGEADR